MGFFDLVFRRRAKTAVDAPPARGSVAPEPQPSPRISAAEARLRDPELFRAHHQEAAGAVLATELVGGNGWLSARPGITADLGRLRAALMVNSLCAPLCAWLRARAEGDAAGSLEALREILLDETRGLFVQAKPDVLVCAAVMLQREGVPITYRRLVEMVVGEDVVTPHLPPPALEQLARLEAAISSAT
jgi:hypothetical protein